MNSSILFTIRKNSDSYIVNGPKSSSITTSLTDVPDKEEIDNEHYVSFGRDHRLLKTKNFNSTLIECGTLLSSSISTTYASSNSSSLSTYEDPPSRDSIDQIDPLPSQYPNNGATSEQMENESKFSTNEGFILGEENEATVRDNNKQKRAYLNSTKVTTQKVSVNTTSAIKNKNVIKQYKAMNSTPDNCFVSLDVNGKRCLVMLSAEYLSFEQELTATSTNNDRVTIKLSDIISVWICTCRTRTYRPIQLCDCIVTDHSKSLNVSATKLINPSKKEPPFIVKIYYAIQTKANGFQLEMITLSAQQRQRLLGNNNSDMNDDIATVVHRQKHLLAEIAYNIRQTIDLFERPKRLLLFINPFGGSKRGIKIFKRKVKPILVLARVETKVIVTEYADQAKNMILDYDNNLMEYDGIICIGGDGMFGEVLNGVLIRTQRENNINYGSIDSALKKPDIKLGIIPAGSTDAIVFATCGFKDPINSVIPIVLGKTISIDVGAVHHRDEEKLIRYTASFMGYGFFGDTILESERIRWLGPKRYDLAGLKKFFKHRLYSGEIKLCIEPNDGSPEDYNPCGTNCYTCQQAGVKSREKLSAEDSPACISIRGRFLAINSAIISGRCKMSKYGMSPMAHVGNGCTDLILVSKCSRFDYLRYLFSLAFRAKNCSNFDFVDSYRVREFEFNPIIEPHKRKGYMFEKSVDCDFFDAFDDDEVNGGDSSNENFHESSGNKTNGNSKLSNNIKKGKKTTKVKRKGCSLTSSVWNCDGEIVNDAAIHAKIHCQMVKIYAPGFDVEQLLDKKIN